MVTSRSARPLRRSRDSFRTLPRWESPRCGDAVQEVSRAHYTHGLPDPTLGGPVAAAINDIAKIDPPRSWPAEEKLRFLTLPYDVQLIISKRERDRDNQVRKIQNELAQFRKEHANGVQTDTEQAAA